MTKTYSQTLQNTAKTVLKRKIYKSQEKNMTDRSWDNNNQCTNRNFLSKHKQTSYNPFSTFQKYSLYEEETKHTTLKDKL